MVTVMPLPNTRTHFNPEYTLTRVLADAIDQGKLPPGACDILSYSQHLNNDQQQQFVIHTETGDYFLKMQPESEHAVDQFNAETRGLLSIAASHSIRTAVPFATGTVDGSAYILLSHLQLAVHGDWQQAGMQLAGLHSQTSDRGYGFDFTTYCGPTPLNNDWHQSWASFFIKQRLEPLLDMLALQGDHLTGAERAFRECAARLSSHHPQASLLHGDLWSGNIGFIPDSHGSMPVIYDPACYYGDAEADLAMTELFGRFPESFYQGYREVRSISDEYEERRPVYQLFHLLNHAVLFGGHYVTQSRDLMRRL